MGKTFVVNEGDGAFYGPKLDFHIADCLGRTWQCGTIQLDSQLPERFELEYVGADGEKHRPIMIHRVVFGSIERFIGVITEHFAGAFPTWLAPVQVKVLPLTDRTLAVSQDIAAQLEGTCYVTRQSVQNVPSILKAKKAIRKAFEYSMQGKGSNLVEIVSTCNTNWRMSPDKANKWMEENMILFYPLGDLKDNGK